MPFKLRNSDRLKLNKLIDQVKILSDTVDELREEINSLKLRSIDSSKSICTTENCENIGETSDKIHANTLQRLKRRLEKNIIPYISIDTGYRVKNKLQRIFSQSPRTINVKCPAHLSSRESSLPQNTLSPMCTRRDCQIHESCQTSKSDMIKIIKPTVKEETLSISSRDRQRNEYTKKFATISSSSSSQRSIKKYRDKTLKKSRCSYEFSKDSKSSEKHERKSKNEANVRLAQTFHVDDTTNEEFTKKPHLSVKNLRNIDFLDNKKKSIAIEAKESSTSSDALTCNTSLSDLWNFKIRYKEAKRAYKKRKTKKGRSNGKKSRSSQCSSECKNTVWSKSSPRDVSTNTIFHDFREKKICKKIAREEKLRNRKTQTCSRINENFDVIERYCSEATKKLHHLVSLTSLTSCLPRSASMSSLGMEKFGEESRQDIRNNGPEKVKFQFKRANEEIEKKKNIVKEANVACSLGLEKKIVEKNNEPRSNEKFPKNRKKRTYVVSSDIPSGKIDSTVQHNFHGNGKDSSSVVEVSELNENNIISLSCRKTSKKPEVNSRFCETANLRGTICRSFPIQREDRNLKKSVCTKRSTSNYLPKFRRWSRKKSTSTNEKIIRPRIRQQISSFSSKLSDNSCCSLTSDSNVYDKLHYNSINVKYPRNNLTNERPKNDAKVLFSLRDTDVTNHSVCGSLSGSARSISCES